MSEQETNRSMIIYNKVMERRDMVRGLTCHHKKEIRLDEFGRPYWACDKNDKECMIEGQCPEVKPKRARLKIRRKKDSS